MTPPTNSGFLVVTPPGRYDVIAAGDMAGFINLNRDSAAGSHWVNLGPVHYLDRTGFDPMILGISAINSTVSVKTGLLDLVVHHRINERHSLLNLQRMAGPPWKWRDPIPFGSPKITPYGAPALIQGSYGRQANNYEMLIPVQGGGLPVQGGGLAHYWLPNDGSAMFDRATERPVWEVAVIFPETSFRAVALIQRESPRGMPGELEAIAATTSLDVSHPSEFWHIAGSHTADPGHRPAWRLKQILPGPDFSAGNGMPGHGSATGQPSFLRIAENPVLPKAYTSWLITPLTGGGMAEITSFSTDSGEAWGTWNIVNLQSRDYGLLDHNLPAVQAVSAITGRNLIFDHPAFDIVFKFQNDDLHAIDVRHSIRQWSVSSSGRVGYQWTASERIGFIV